MPYEIAEQTISIPLKYLIKAEDEAKEPKFKVGDLALQSNEKVRNRELICHSTINTDCLFQKANP